MAYKPDWNGGAEELRIFSFSTSHKTVFPYIFVLQF